MGLGFVGFRVKGLGLQSKLLKAGYTRLYLGSIIAVYGGVDCFSLLRWTVRSYIGLGYPPNRVRIGCYRGALGAASGALHDQAFSRNTRRREAEKETVLPAGGRDPCNL